VLNAKPLECDCNPPEVPAGDESIHEAELAIHRQKLIAAASIEAIHAARAEGSEIDESHELVLTMRAAHSTLTDWRLQRNRARRANERYQNSRPDPWDWQYRSILRAADEAIRGPHRPNDY